MDKRTDSLFSPDELGQHYFANIGAYRLLAYSYVRDEKIAEDIVSDGFLRLWEHREDLDPDKGDFRFYIVRIIKNLCCQYIRTRNLQTKIHRQLNDRSEWQLQISLQSLENEEIERRLFLDDVERITRRALGKLPPLTREIFVDSRIHALSHKEIAEKYNIPVRRVVWEISKVLSLLRDSLKDYLPLLLLLLQASQIGKR